MSILEKYNKIYEEEIECLFKKEIATYDDQSNFNYQAFSHNCETLCTRVCNHQCYKSLGRLMRKNVIFYCYGEDEIIKMEKKDMLDDLEKVCRFAYRNRLPKRIPEQDGLPGEVLFDLIIQTMYPNAFKLAVRTIFRQDDNNEIKGYDLTYFSIEKGKVTLWLGQAKLGAESYCKNGINTDLVSKFESDYLSKQIYFLADKQCGLSAEGLELTEKINDLNLINTDQNDKQRAEAFVKYLKDNDISIKIPCLLAYGKNSVYANVAEVEEAIVKEINNIKNYFDKKTYHFNEFQPQLLFFIFPLEDLVRLRGKGGFYEGLR